MSADDAPLSRHPAPHRERTAGWALTFGLLGGPVVWFVQLCAGVALTSWPCFPKDQPLPAPVGGFEWTWTATALVSLAAFGISLAAMLISHNLLRRTRDEEAGGHRHLLEVGTGRTRFLALWGTMAGGVFAVAIAFTGVAFYLLPRCAG
jgi:hypothetical protein